MLTSWMSVIFPDILLNMEIRSTLVLDTSEDLADFTYDHAHDVESKQL